MRTTLIWTAAVGAMWATSTIARAQEAQAQATHPVAKNVKVDLRKVFREIDKRIDALWPKCDTCKGRGKVTVKGKIGRSGRTVSATVRECPKCDGIGWVSVADDAYFRGQFARPAQEIEDEGVRHRNLLDAFIDYFELSDRHADALGERKNKRLAKRVREDRSRFLTEISGGLGVTTMEIMTAPPGVPQRFGETRGSPARYEKRPVCRLYTGLSLNLIVGKTSPIGHGIAFRGRIVRVAEEGTRRVVEVEIEGIRGRVYECFVIIPDGKRWVPGASVLVIGKVIDPSAFAELKKRLPDAVIVQPGFGTE